MLGDSVPCSGSEMRGEPVSRVRFDASVFDRRSALRPRVGRFGEESESDGGGVSLFSAVALGRVRSDRTRWPVERVVGGRLGR